ncbi:MAG: cytochrome c [Gemmatimonadota bacterium]|jgi:mono/diheme cytochrome c family protein
MSRRERGRALPGVLLAAALALAGSGCTALDNTLASVPVFAFLRDAPFFDPYEAPRPAPENSVPYDSPVGVDVPPIEASENGLNAFAATSWGINPLDPADTAVQALGKKMFDRYCLVCHGVDGKGNGPITGENKYPPIAPNLTLPITVNRPDGYLYGMIRVARSGLMPAYGPRLNHRERWAIVTYVRALQTAAASADNASAAAPAARN